MRAPLRQLALVSTRLRGRLIAEKPSVSMPANSRRVATGSVCKHDLKRRVNDARSIVDLRKRSIFDGIPGRRGSLRRKSAHSTATCAVASKLDAFHTVSADQPQLRGDLKMNDQQDGQNEKEDQAVTYRLSIHRAEAVS